MPTPRWRALPDGWPYAVSEYGDVRSFVTGRILKPQRHPMGYLQVRLQDRTRSRRSFVSRLVCLAFHGEPPSSEHEASHLDGRPGNNHESNLKWETAKVNNWRKGRYENLDIPF